MRSTRYRALLAQCLFVSEFQAGTVYDTDRRSPSSSGAVRRIEQRGRRLVVATEQDTLDFQSGPEPVRPAMFG
ncbi:hypothetical protein NDI56_12220 [Haloarcula sp. S1CR25-12]|uniref:Uncharacterized protein n=1 Tax=Haloarcula saliterrae TaxID=2950534 RepID=A0ABU2FEC4_9EURY|nr:hypothetical protein [Haloarcula sp. S1CR25-12]MDS0260161.1 hypothetical protein [Haloarcula sp. S1CR25-12]